jgi:hypothetical protein
MVDSNVGKLARWLRIAGFDTVFMKDVDDNVLVRAALREDRILLTRDTGILERRIVVNGKLKVILIREDDVKSQLRQVLSEYSLKEQIKPFTRCAECNVLLETKDREDVKHLVPPHVFKTKAQYMCCPTCGRVYWRGTHWEKMSRELEEIVKEL